MNEDQEKLFQADQLFQALGETFAKEEVTKGILLSSIELIENFLIDLRERLITEGLSDIVSEEGSISKGLGLIKDKVRNGDKHVLLSLGGCLQDLAIDELDKDSED